MRATNREINIFNMSLLDILTGMLGAFLFLMLGLLPFYSKAIKLKPEEAEKQQERNKELEKQLDELKKLADQAKKGPLTPEQAEQLRTQIAAMQQQIAQLQDMTQKLQNYANQLENQIAEAKQKLDDANKETNFWASQDGTISLTSGWDSEATDIDVFAMTPKGSIYGQKKEKLLGHPVINSGVDSHGPDWKTNSEGLVFYLAADGSGDYLIFYRVPKDALPATYANLRGSLIYHETADKNSAQIYYASLPPTNAAAAKPGGLYAWAIIQYDAKKHSLAIKPFTGKPPGGILVPQ